MDWKHEQHRRELKAEMARHEAAQSVNLLYEMERDFKRIFGVAKNAGSSRRRASDISSVGPEKASSLLKSHKTA